MLTYKHDLKFTETDMYTSIELDLNSNFSGTFFQIDPLSDGVLKHE